MGRTPVPVWGQLSASRADAGPGFSQPETMFADKYLIFKNEILITALACTVRL